jgi:hypothetical protein
MMLNLARGLPSNKPRGISGPRNSQLTGRGQGFQKKVEAEFLAELWCAEEVVLVQQWAARNSRL